MTSRYKSGPVAGRYRRRGLSPRLAALEVSVSEYLGIQMRIQKRSWRRCKRSLLRLARLVRDLSPEAARQFFDDKEACAELMRVDFQRDSTRTACRFAASFHLTDRYFDALAAVRARDVEFFAVQVGCSRHGGALSV